MKLPSVHFCLAVGLVWPGAVFAAENQTAPSPVPTVHHVDGYHGGVRGHMRLGCYRDILNRMEAEPDWKVSLDTTWREYFDRVASPPAKDWHLTGVLGPIREVHVWTPHPIYPCSLERPRDTPPVPEGLDWDLWLGPAPYRPYHPAYVPFKWRAWWDFGSGTVADMACHSFHVFFRALKLDQRPPKTVSAYSSQHREPSGRLLQTRECESDANQVSWEFPAAHDLPPLSLHWYDGGMRPLRPAELEQRVPMLESGLLFVGEQGKVLSGFGGGRNVLLPAAKFKDYQCPAPTLPRTIGHYREWTEGCKTNTPTNCPMDFGCQMTETALLGTIALRRLVPDRPSTSWSAKLLEWDADAMRITNDDTANTYVNPPYRKGWSL